LRGLVFYCCRETRNRVFQFSDPLLLLLEFTGFHLGLGALGTACSQLRTAIHKGRAKVTIGIDVYGQGRASINGRSENATYVCGRVIGSAGGDPADGKHILIAGKTGIADVHIVADDVWIRTCSSAQGDVEIASAILKRQIAHRSIVAPVDVVG
jgi:hypothetical protein